MTEWQAIGWVFGGIVVFLSLFFTIKNYLEKRDEKTIKRTREEVEEESSLNANWKKTREMAEVLGKTKELIEITNVAVLEMMQARNSNIDREQLKYDVSREVSKKFAQEDETFATLYKRFLKVEEKERESRNKPIDIPATPKS